MLSGCTVQCTVLSVLVFLGLVLFTVLLGHIVLSMLVFGRGWDACDAIYITMPSCTNRPQIIISKLVLKLTWTTLKIVFLSLEFVLHLNDNWYVRIWRLICRIWGLMGKAELILDYWGILQVLALCGLVFSIIENNQTAFNSFQNNDDHGGRSKINDKL